jgi:iron complex outermembrane recepter protein
LVFIRPITRSGANLRLDFKLSPESRFFINAFYTGFLSKQGYEGGTQTITGLAQVVTLDADGRPIPFQPQFPFGHPNYRAGTFNAVGNRVQASILPGYTDQVTELVNATYRFSSAPNTTRTQRYSFQPGGRHRLGEVEIDYSGIYQVNSNQSGDKNNSPDGIRIYQVTVPNTSWRLDGSRMQSPIRRLATQTDGPDITNPSNWSLGGLTTTVIDRGGSIYGGQINLKRSFANLTTYYIKGGLKFMSEQRNAGNPNKTLTYTGPQGEFLTRLIRTGQPSGVPSGGKWYAMPGIPQYFDVDKITQLHAEHPEYFGEDPAISLQNRLENDKTATEDVMSGYALGHVALGNMTVLGGVRIEKTQVKGESAVEDPRAGIGIADPLQRVQAIWGGRQRAKRDYLNVLPGIHFKYEAGRSTVIRASYAASLGRPSFGSIYPDTRINYDNRRVTQNNPGLKPQTADNFDLSIERYFEPVGIVSAGVFLKELNNFHFHTVTVIPTGEDNGFDREYAGWDLATQASGGTARVRGLELNYSQQLSFLPGIWSGFGIFANYTCLETSGNYGRIGQAPSSELEDFSPRVANYGLSYSRGFFSGRVNANYTGEYLRAYNANPLLRSYRKSRTMVDLKLGFKLTRKVTLFIDASNIFNSEQIWFTGKNRDRITDIRDHGARVQAGINGRL